MQAPHDFAVQFFDPHRNVIAEAIANVFFLNRPSGSSATPALFRTPGANRLALAAQLVFGAYLLAMYTRLGWSRVGVIPGYALYPDGRTCDTTVFYKSLERA